MDFVLLEFSPSLQLGKELEFNMKKLQTKEKLQTKGKGVAT